MNVEICNIAHEASGVLKVDWYVPFSFRAERGGRQPPFLWLIKNPDDNSLIELKIEKSSGIILGVNFIDNGKIELCDVLSHVNVPEISGIPILSNRFDRKIYDKVIDFRFIFSNKNFYILFCNKKPTKCIKSGRIMFYEAQGELVALGFCDLTEDELSILYEKFHL